jgi:ELWxxDGT repeat protein
LFGSSDPQFLTEVNGTLYFSANDGADGTELWKSDGTAAGTVMVKNINSSGSSDPQFLTEVNGNLYFSANDGANGTEPWRLSSDTDDHNKKDTKNGGCFIATAGNAWSSTHDSEALPRSKERVLCTARGNKALGQLYHAWSPVMACFTTARTFVWTVVVSILLPTVLLLGLFLMIVSILICFKIMRVSPEASGRSVCRSPCECKKKSAWQRVLSACPFPDGRRIGTALLNDERHNLAAKRAGPGLFQCLHPSCRQVDMMVEDGFLLALEARSGKK